MSGKLIEVIDFATKDPLVKSIINSENTRQHACKDWLVAQTENYIGLKDQFSVCVAGGWFGLMAHKLREKYHDKITELVSFDRDKNCVEIGKMLYKNSKINFQWQTIENFQPYKFDIIVSTSCEHFTDTELNNFIKRKRHDTVVVLQSNNYFSRPDHINCKSNLEEFANCVNLNVIDRMQFETDAYTRYMIVGK